MESLTPARADNNGNGNNNNNAWRFTSIRQLLPSSIPIGARTAYNEMAKLSLGYTWQSLLKLLLTEGEKMILVSLPAIFSLFGVSFLFICFVPIMLIVT